MSTHPCPKECSFCKGQQRVVPCQLWDPHPRLVPSPRECHCGLHELRGLRNVYEGHSPAAVSMCPLSSSGMRRKAEGQEQSCDLPLPAQGQHAAHRDSTSSGVLRLEGRGQRQDGAPRGDWRLQVSLAQFQPPRAQGYRQLLLTRCH